MYAKYIKRPLGFFLSLCAIIVLSPLIIVLMVIGAVQMRGNPFFTQLRPGKNEKIFRLIKFRTMTCKTDDKGELLPDGKRLTRYGKILRASSLDELPELFNILKGDMAVIGPRPLLIKYLPFYTDEERHRHDVRPGLTGLAQISGRNFLNWKDRFELDVKYVNSIRFVGDIKIIIGTVVSVFKHKDIMEMDNEKGKPGFENLDDERRELMGDSDKKIESSIG